MLILKCSILVLLLGFPYGNSLNVDDLDEINSHKQFALKLEEFLKRDNELSKVCSYSLQQYALGLITRKEWALMMFDSGSKLPSGILEGNLIDLGSFDECLNIESQINSTLSIAGRYCLGTLSFTAPPGKSNSLLMMDNPIVQTNLRADEIPIQLPFKLATCLPDTCSPKDIQTLYTGLGISMTFPESLCQTKAEQPELDAGAIAAISFFGVILWIVVASTAYDIVLHYTKAKPVHSLLLIFSVFTNGRKLLATNKSPNQISCLNGIRVLSIMWIILGHGYSVNITFPLMNTVDLFKWYADEWSMYVLNAIIAVDTFFMVGGLVLSYVFLSTMEKGVKFNIIVYYLHRYLRLTPALVVVMVVYITLLKYLSSGPLFPTTMESLSAPCREGWWKVLLYAQNYGNIETICISHTWYLDVDMQLFLISPIILVPMTKFPLLSIVLTGALTVGSVIASFVTAWVYDINGIVGGNLYTPEMEATYFREYYTATHTRAAPWLIGILFGYLIFKIKQRGSKIVLNKAFVSLMWIVSLTIFGACVFAGHNLITEEYDRLANAFHVALVRPAWSVACGWLILACFLGYGGPINWFLSLPIFQVLSRLTYSLYLVHYSLLFIRFSSLRMPTWFSTEQKFFTFWGDLVSSIIVAAILTLVFESPIIGIEKFLFGGGEQRSNTSQKSRVNVQNVSELDRPPNTVSIALEVNDYDKSNSDDIKTKDIMNSNSESITDKSVMESEDVEKGTNL